MIDHFDGNRNISAHMVTRWAKRYRKKILSTKSICCLSSTGNQVPTDVKDIYWPTKETIRARQQSAGVKPSGTHKGDD